MVRMPRPTDISRCAATKLFTSVLRRVASCSTSWATWSLPRIPRVLVTQHAPSSIDGTSIDLVSQPRITPVGVAVNTCNEVVYADSGHEHASRRVGTGGYHSSDILGNDKPLYIEIDSSNVMYVVTGRISTGPARRSGGQILDFATTGCSTCIAYESLVDLKNQADRGSESAPSAMGIAVAATDNTLTHDSHFYSSDCNHCADIVRFRLSPSDFGVHRLRQRLSGGASRQSTSKR